MTIRFKITLLFIVSIFLLIGLGVRAVILAVPLLEERFLGLGACGCLRSGLTWLEGMTVGSALLFSLGIIAGLSYLFYTLLATRHLYRQLRNAPWHSVAPQVFCVTGPHWGTFTLGFFRPKIVLCAHCTQALSEAQQEALLAHEKQHLLKRDPLCLFLARLAAVSFFYVPWLRQLQDLYRNAVELEADAVVVDQSGLASLLVRLASFQPRSFSGVRAPFAASLSLRLARLSSPNWHWHPRMWQKELFFTVVFLFGWGSVLFHQTGGQDLAYSCLQPQSVCVRSLGNPLDAAPATYYNKTTTLEL